MGEDATSEEETFSEWMNRGNIFNWGYSGTEYTPAQYCEEVYDDASGEMSDAYCMLIDNYMGKWH
jgi:hypothetical protein